MLNTVPVQRPLVSSARNIPTSIFHENYWFWPSLTGFSHTFCHILDSIFLPISGWWSRDIYQELSSSCSCSCIAWAVGFPVLCLILSYLDSIEWFKLTLVCLIMSGLLFWLRFRWWRQRSHPVNPMICNNIEKTHVHEDLWAMLTNKEVLRVIPILNMSWDPFNDFLNKLFYS